MKKVKYRVMAAALCAAFLLCGFSTTAYAGGGEEWEDCTGGPEWEGLVPVEPMPTPEPEPNPFTPDGQGTVVDNATDQDSKEEQWHELKTEGISRLLPLHIQSGAGVWASTSAFPKRI